MSDGILAVSWLAILAGGLSASVLARRLGLSATHARDLLHVGAGVWVLGWPYWDGLAAPLTIVWAAAAAVALVPVAAPRFEPADRFRRSVSGDDEAFGGLVVYTLAFAVMTTLGLTARPFPAAAAPAAAGLLALALGDGLGGLIGRRFGRLRYALPWGKRKSVEGSVAVAGFAALGVMIAAAWLGADVAAWRVPALGLVAALAEALAPRGTDNAVVPVAVWATARML
jgi:dolichol kinase